HPGAELAAVVPLVPDGVGDVVGEGREEVTHARVGVGPGEAVGVGRADGVDQPGVVSSDGLDGGRPGAVAGRHALAGVGNVRAGAELLEVPVVVAAGLAGGQGAELAGVGQTDVADDPAGGLGQAGGQGVADGFGD